MRQLRDGTDVREIHRDGDVSFGERRDELRQLRPDISVRCAWLAHIPGVQRIGGIRLLITPLRAVVRHDRYAGRPRVSAIALVLPGEHMQTGPESTRSCCAGMVPDRFANGLAAP